MEGKGIQKKLTIILVGVSLIGMTAVFVLNYLVMRENVRSELLQKIGYMVEAEGNKIDGWFQKQLTFVDSLATAITEVDDKETALKILKAQASRNSEYTTTYMGFSDDSGMFSEGEPGADWKATQRGWYQSAMAAGGKPALSEPYLDVVTGRTVIAVTKDIGEFAGVRGALGVDMDLSTLLEVVNHVDTSGGYAFLVNQNGLIVAHPDNQFNPDGDRYVNMEGNAVYGKMFPVSETVYKIEDYDGVNRYVFPCPVSSSGWILYAAIPVSAVLKVINPDYVTILVSILFLIGAALLVNRIIRRMVVAPLKAVAQAGDSIAKGNLEVALGHAPKDEIGQVLNQFQVIVDNIRKQSDVLHSISQQDFSVGIAPRSSKDVMNVSLQKMIETIRQTLSEVRGSTAQVSMGVRQIAAGAQNLAQGSAEQAATVEELSASLVNIVRDTQANSAKAEEAASLAKTIKARAEKGNAQMEEMIAAVRDITDASHSIGKIIKVINDIAFQTNILALNAAVESARAGEHGKGFAVVAAEVRTLAVKSAEAAKDTGQLIADSIEKADLGAQIARDTADSLAEIVAGINESDRIAGEIARLSERQALAVSQIDIGISQVAQVVQQNTATAEESAAASEQLNGQSQMLEGLISSFKFD